MTPSAAGGASTTPTVTPPSPSASTVDTASSCAESATTTAPKASYSCNVALPRIRHQPRRPRVGWTNNTEPTPWSSCPSATLKAGPLTHLPSGSFHANSAWLQCAASAHNLLRWTTSLGGIATGDLVVAKTIRRRYLNVPARLVNRSGRLTLLNPARWVNHSRQPSAPCAPCHQHQADHPARSLAHRTRTPALTTDHPTGPASTRPNTGSAAPSHNH